MKDIPYLKPVVGIPDAHEQPTKEELKQQEEERILEAELIVVAKDYLPKLDELLAQPYSRRDHKEIKRISSNLKQAYEFVEMQAIKAMGVCPTCGR